MNISFAHGIACLLVCALATPPDALAQAPVPPPLPSIARQASAPAFTQQALDQMLAPVALYPDALLAQVLVAATYPLEIVQAARWTQQHNGLTGTALQDALQGQPWDESVKALCAFPAVLDRMNQGLDWTQNLGNAFIDQRQQVMDTVQALRGKAQAAGNLQSNAQQTVALDNNAITIVPTNPQIVYVPTYNPALVYGSWPWPAYPPYYPSYWDPGLGPGFFWGAGIVGGLVLLAGGFDWHRHEVFIHRNREPFRGPERFRGREPFRGPEQSRGPDNRFGEMPGGMGHEGERGGGGRR